jgi:hypothetical protein
MFKLVFSCISQNYYLTHISCNYKIIRKKQKKNIINIFEDNNLLSQNKYILTKLMKFIIKIY